MNTVPELLRLGTRVIDLSADFRLRDAGQWSHWYGEPHACPEVIEQAVYGLPEVYREQIATAQLVACAGCYPTAVQLGLLPLLKAGVADLDYLIANAASGVSGAGRQGKLDNILSEAADSFKAYAVTGHRHLPEIEQELAQAAGESVQLTFVPHLLPMIRGIHATLYTKVAPEVDVQQLFEAFYRDEPFVDVLPAGQLPQTRSVRGANICRLAVERPQGRDVVVVMSVIDNLVKGASGQAIQALNIMFGQPETAGLTNVALLP
jgi:N-acetyl-gamma-glutamyl-phosphate reductase